VNVSHVFTLVSDADYVARGAYPNGPHVGVAIGLRATRAAAARTHGHGCVHVRAVGSRVHDGALETAVDSSLDYVDEAAAAAAAATNVYAL